MKNFAILAVVMFSMNAFSFAPKLPKAVVCVEKKGLNTSVLILDLLANEGVVKNYKLTRLSNGQILYSFTTRVKELSDTSLSVEGYINNPDRSDVIGYAGYDFETGKGYYQEAANDGMSPLPGFRFSSCKSF
jgi:hypothetical protein